MKIAVIGGGSTYTPELMSEVGNRADALGLTEIALHDISSERLSAVGGLVRRMLEARGFTGNIAIGEDLDAALDGADFVVIQIRVGGQATRLNDETIPLEFGCIGQETTGAGGLAKAMRTVPVVLDIAERARAHARPGAWIISFTNPVGIVTRALLDQGHRAVGLCNVAISLQRSIADLIGIDSERVEIHQVGLNHLTWVRAVLIDGVDALPAILRDHGDALASEVELPRRLLDELGMIPSYYLRYFYEHDAVLAEQQTGVPRAATVGEIEARLLSMYRDPSLTEKPALLGERGGAHYSHAAIDLITSLVTGNGDVLVVDTRNSGALPGLAYDDVVEVPARIGSDGPQPIEQAPLPPEVLGLIQHTAAYERLASQAAMGSDRSIARRALMAHPLIGQYAVANALADRMFES